jgi:hypothetical protein
MAGPYRRQMTWPLDVEAKRDAVREGLRGQLGHHLCHDRAIRRLILAGELDHDLVDVGCSEGLLHLRDDVGGVRASIDEDDAQARALSDDLGHDPMYPESRRANHFRWAGQDSNPRHEG